MKNFLIALGIIAGIWNGILLMSISMTFLGFIWGFQDTWQKALLALPMSMVVAILTAHTTKEYAEHYLG